MAEPLVDAFGATLDLFHTGIDVMRQSLRRRHPEATEQEIARRLRAWLLERPGAESGECPGRAITVLTRFV